MCGERMNPEKLNQGLEITEGRVLNTGSSLM